MRSFEDEKRFIHQIDECTYRIDMGFVPNMRVPGYLCLNESLIQLILEELEQFVESKGVGGFLPAVKQVANVASLPGVIGYSIGLPDMHSGYGFAIGNVAAMDMTDPEAVVSPGGVGFDINCGVRLIRTNLNEEDILPVKESLIQALFDHIPVGVGSKGSIPMSMKTLDEALEKGVDWCIENGYAWPEDKEHCEEYGRMTQANSRKVSDRAKKRGLSQLGTLGAGNHYAEIQVVDEIFDEIAAKTMGIHRKGQVCIMIHSGSRGLGHQVATDALQIMEKAIRRDRIHLNDRQLACARIQSEEGQNYLEAMAAAANFAWVNRSSMTYLTRKAFSEVLGRSAIDMDMHLIYDVSHNVAKIEEHEIKGHPRKLLVHRKGSTRAFPPNHPLVPLAYRSIGQPVLIGGTMGTCSFVMTGTEKGMRETFGSTCHGAGRAQSRNKTRHHLNPNEVLQRLKEQGVSIRVASPKLVMEEAPEAYKDVTEVVKTCHDAGISKMTFRLRPVAVIKG